MPYMCKNGHLTTMLRETEPDLTSKKKEIRGNEAMFLGYEYERQIPVLEISCPLCSGIAKLLKE